MQQLLKYPTYPVRIRKVSAQMQIFDSLRRRWLVLTPEEWVRQHVVNYLVTEKKVPQGIISVEKELVLNGQKKRYDILVFTRELKPWLVVECKAPYIELTPAVAEQALRYNLTLGAEYVMITNGVSEIVFEKQVRIPDLPAFT